jgi:Rps23 Pro-64 3,4-dihydroxylase Tpa1-like proline 4-hydroxylase
VGSYGKDWAYFFSRSYIYPAGCGLSWHRDNEHNATGAFVYYAHPYWDPQWGGEFLVASLKTKEAVFPKTKTYEGQEKFLGSHMENSHEIPILMEEGVGTYILPKPNRLVFLTSGVIHCIKKVEAAAGNKLRGTIQGFFQDPVGVLQPEKRKE